MRRAAIFITIVSMLGLAAPAYANTLSSGAAHRAAARNANALGRSFSPSDGVGTFTHSGVNSCARLTRHAFSCEIEDDFTQDDGSVIGCASDVFAFTVGRSNRVLVRPEANTTDCEFIG